jgi:benzoyl-CoA reductase/2-hydroxyglutaryl-CoA dehydratase subunit BcrC/BadD/HgdB
LNTPEKRHHDIGGTRAVTETTKEAKYLQALPKKEIEEARTMIKAASVKIIEENLQRMRKTWPARPKEIEYFDEIANFSKREEELLKAKEEGKKVIGYFCIFAPIELILAADAIPVRVNSGWYDPAKFGDRIVPVEVCPVIRSTIGAKMVNLSPYLELSDAILSTLTCDGMTKLSEIISNSKPVWTMVPPRIKDSAQAIRFWSEQIRSVKKKLEQFTGNKITRRKLKEAIEITQKATKAFRRLQQLRSGPPVIMGRDAMLVNQTSMWDNLERWTAKTEALCEELEKRAAQKKWACPTDTPRVLITGTPMFWPDNWKLPAIVEEATPQGVIVADELCSSDRFLYDPVGVDEWTENDMLNAISERYLMASTCPCFTSEDGNEDRVNWLLNKVKEAKVDGVIYCVVHGCMLYAMEYTRIKRALDKINIPVYYLDTEYTREDVGQIKTRVEAFLEMLTTRIEV